MSKKVSLFIIIFVLIASGCASTHIEDPTGRSSLSEAYSGPFPCCFHQEAEYPGGPKAMMKFINDNLRYPEEVVPRKGRVIVKFFIDTLGNVCNPTVIKGISAPYDEEALRVVSSFP